MVKTWRDKFRNADVPMADLNVNEIHNYLKITNIRIKDHESKLKINKEVKEGLIDELKKRGTLVTEKDTILPNDPIIIDNIYCLRHNVHDDVFIDRINKRTVYKLYNDEERKKMELQST